MEKKEKNKEESLHKAIIVMRHGERIDCISKSSQILSEYDPELTEKGIEQAKDIGKQLKKSLNKEVNFFSNFNNFFLLSI